MKRPRHVFIEPFRFTIEARPDWARETGNSGNCLTDDQLIVTDVNLSEQNERDTTLHEVLHALFAQTSLKKNYTDEQEEEIIWSLTPRLLGFLKDNPAFIEWLVGK